MISGTSHRIANATQLFGQNTSAIPSTKTASALTDPAVKAVSDAFPGANVEVGQLWENEGQKRLYTISRAAQGQQQNVNLPTAVAEKMAKDPAFRKTVLENIKAEFAKSPTETTLSRGVEVKEDGTVTPWAVTAEEFKNSQLAASAMNALQGSSLNTALLDALATSSGSSNVVETGILDNYSELMGLKKLVASAYGATPSSSSISTLA